MVLSYSLRQLSPRKYCTTLHVTLAVVVSATVDLEFTSTGVSGGVQAFRCLDCVWCVPRGVVKQLIQESYQKKEKNSDEKGPSKTNTPWQVVYVLSDKTKPSSCVKFPVQPVLVPGGVARFRDLSLNVTRQGTGLDRLACSDDEKIKLLTRAELGHHSSPRFPPSLSVLCSSMAAKDFVTILDPARLPLDVFGLHVRVVPKSEADGSARRTRNPLQLSLVSA